MRRNVLVANIERRIQISVQLIATGATVKQGLRTTVRPMLIATPATGLRSMPWINFDDLDTPFLSFIGQKPVELGKTPTMQAAFGILFLTLADLTALSEVFEVFQDDGTALWSVLHHQFGEHVVTIPVESQSLPRQLLEMSFGAFCSFGLQLSSEAETASVYLFPVTTPQEVTGRGNGGSVQSPGLPR